MSTPLRTVIESAEPGQDSEPVMVPALAGMEPGFFAAENESDVVIYDENADSISILWVETKA